MTRCGYIEVRKQCLFSKEPTQLDFAKMNAAVNKLKKDIWKDEAVDRKAEALEEEWHDLRQRLRERKIKKQSLQEQRQKRLEEEKAKAGAKEQKGEEGPDLSSLEEALIQGKLEAERLQQTQVSKIRRSIFKLPVSSPYTQYYPADTQTDQAQLKQVEKRLEIPTPSKGQGKTKASSTKLEASKPSDSTRRETKTEAKPGAKVSRVKAAK